MAYMVASEPLVVNRTRSAPVCWQMQDGQVIGQIVDHARLQAIAFGEHLGERGGDLGRVVSQDVGKVSLPKVEDVMPVQVLHICARRGLDVYGKRFIEAQRVLAAVDHHRLCLRVLFCGAGKSLTVLAAELRRTELTLYSLILYPFVCCDREVYMGGIAQESHGSYHRSR